MNQQLKDYILANHQQMTCSEMAKGYSEQSGVETPNKQIQSYLTYLGLKAVSPADRVKKYILEHQDLPAVQIAANLGYTAEAIRKYAKEMGIVLPPAKNVSEDESDADMGAFSPSPKKRFSEPYTQSGSPFKIADEIRNLKIK